MNLDYDRGGEGPRLLVLLHGLGATRQVWEPLLSDAKRHWQGSWIAPDLRGHGRSAWATSYALGLHASDVADLITDAEKWSEIVVLGHSMGGAIALALCSGWFGVAPARAFGLGIKVAWSEEELEHLRKLSAAPIRTFATKEAAIERYLRVSGLVGLAATTSSLAEAGVTTNNEGWCLAADPAAASVGAPPMAAMLATAKCPVHLARGEKDVMVSHDQLTEFDRNTVSLPALGHNAMVEDPDAVWRWLHERLA